MYYITNYKTLSIISITILCFQLVVSCAAEAENPEVSREYHLLRRMIDVEEQFIEVTDLGEDLAMQVIRYLVLTIYLKLL